MDWEALCQGLRTHVVEISLLSCLSVFMHSGWRMWEDSRVDGVNHQGGG